MKEMGKVEVYRRIQDGDSDTKEYVCFKDGEERDASFVDQSGNYRYEYVGDYDSGVAGSSRRPLIIYGAFNKDIRTFIDIDIVELTEGEKSDCRG